MSLLNFVPGSRKRDWQKFDGAPQLVYEISQTCTNLDRSYQWGSLHLYSTYCLHPTIAVEDSSECRIMVSLETVLDPKP